MDELQSAIKELDEAQAAWDDFRKSNYMPWELDPPVGYEERIADENFRRYARKVSERVTKAREALIKAARAVKQAKESEA